MTDQDLTHPIDGTVVLDAGGYAWQTDGHEWNLADGGVKPVGQPFIDAFGPLRVLYAPTTEER